jgi:MFS superfamily sulfate permease-like transporter
MQSSVDLGLMFLTFFLSIVWDVEVGLLVSVIISLLLVVRRSSKTRMTILVYLRLTLLRDLRLILSLLARGVYME